MKKKVIYLIGITILLINVLSVSAEAKAYKTKQFQNMTIYNFNQERSGSIQGLPHKSACGAYACATILSALTGKLITPGEVMKNMSANCISKRKNATYESKIAASMKSYLVKKYHYILEYKVIKPSQVYSYLNKGYFVVTGINKGRNSKFTVWKHYMALIGYNPSNKVITTNTNQRTPFFIAYPKKFLSGYLAKNNDYIFKNNTVAYKWKFNDTYKKYEKSITVKANKKAKIYTHKGVGYYITIKKGTILKIYGKSGSYYYVKYKKASCII